MKFEQLDSARVPRVFPGKEVSGLGRQIAWEQTSGVPLEAPPPQLCPDWSALALIRLRLSQGKRAINSCMIVTCFALPKSGSSCLQLPELPSPLQLQKGSVSHVSAHGYASPGHEVQFLQVLCPCTRLLALAFAESLLPGIVQLLYKVLQEKGCGPSTCVSFFSTSQAKSFLGLKGVTFILQFWVHEQGKVLEEKEKQ